MGDEAEITELRLGPPGPAMEGGDGGKCKKRTLVEAVEDESSTTEDGGGGVGGGARGEVPPPAKGRVVGWPPVCSFRQRNAGTAKKVYVKVSMDGAPFLRKVELDACRGYADLTAAVEKLFGMRESSSWGLARNDGEIGEHTQIYEDKEGDWMLVGDVPWDMFMESCKRLRLMKSSEAKGFGVQLIRGSSDDKRM